jgi:hypothetical protein
VIAFGEMEYRAAGGGGMEILCLECCGENVLTVENVGEWMIILY